MAMPPPHAQQMVSPGPAPPAAPVLPLASPLVASDVNNPVLFPAQANVQNPVQFGGNNQMNQNQLNQESGIFTAGVAGGGVPGGGVPGGPGGAGASGGPGGGGPPGYATPVLRTPALSAHQSLNYPGRGGSIDLSALGGSAQFSDPVENLNNHIAQQGREKDGKFE